MLSTGRWLHARQPPWLRPRESQTGGREQSFGSVLWARGLCAVGSAWSAAARSRSATPSLMAEDGSDDEDVRRAKRKKKKKQAGPAPPQKIGGLKPRTFSVAELTPFARVLWQGAEPLSDDSPGIAAARQRLGLRVPDVRKLPCKFWQRGTCARGDACSFAHGEGATQSVACCPPPLDSLSEPGLPRCFGRAMLHLGHRTLTAIQAQAWPAALRGHDLLCRAPTGSGKTLGYLLPAAAHTLAAVAPPAGGGPVALVLVPTRELAMQVLGVCRTLRRPCGLRCEGIYGGEPREDQVEAMEGSGLHVLVATTGRLVDMCLSRHVRLDHATFLVLDGTTANRSPTNRNPTKPSRSHTSHDDLAPRLSLRQRRTSCYLSASRCK